MSNFIGRAKNPKTNQIEEAEFLDDFYGRHNYAVRFKDGGTYPEHKVEVSNE